MGPLSKTGKSTMNEAGHKTCGNQVVVRRGSRASGKDHTLVVDLTLSCNKKNGHIGKCSWLTGHPYAPIKR